MCREIEWALATPNARLIITAPPGSAKSRYATQITPAAWLARKIPAGMGNVLLGTHTMGIAAEFGNKTRRIVNDLGDRMGYGLTADTNAKHRWNTSTGREYYAVGVDVGISGIRAGLGILDDLYPSRAEAESETYRAKVFAWLMDDFFRRLTPGAPVIAVNTRWHEDDHVARLEEAWQRSGTPYRIINIRAEAEGDDPLGRPAGECLGEDWKGWDYPGIIRQAKAEMHATGRVREYEALFQQRPAPLSGDFFKAEWLKVHDKVPGNLRHYGASDYAVTEGGGDWTVHVVVGMDEGGDLWLVDLWRERTTPDKWIDALADLILRYRPSEWADEKGQIRGSIEPFLLRRLIERHAFVTRRSFPTKGDKAERAQSIRARMALRGLHVAKDAPWLSTFRHELLSFPAGKHDDQVDALGLIGQLLTTLTAASALPDTRPKPINVHDTRTVADLMGIN